MDQFAPGDIGVLVLRYLASAGCTQTVLNLMEEMPFTKCFLPPRPPSMPPEEYVQLISKPTLSFALVPSLPAFLNDYAMAKVKVAELIQKHMPNRSPNQFEFLKTQLKTVEEIMEALSSGAPKASKASVSVEVQTEACNVSIATQTEAEEEDELLTSPAEVQQLFYRNMLEDSSIPEKLASTINSHMVQAVSSSSKASMLERVYFEAESEIDRFMVDFLESDSCSNLILPNSVRAAAALGNDSMSSGSGFSNLFNDANSLIGKDNDNVVNDNVVNDNVVNDNVVNDNVVNDNGISQPLEFPQNISQPVPSPSKSKQPPPINRIVVKPPPITITAPKATPIFQVDPEPVVERRVSKNGHNYSIISKQTPVKTDWEKLGRRQIDPKITPPSVTFNINPEKVNSSETRGKESTSKKRRRGKFTPSKLTPDKAKDAEFLFVCHDPKPNSSSDSTSEPSLPAQSPKKPVVVETTQASISPKPNQSLSASASASASHVSNSKPMPMDLDLPEEGEIVETPEPDTNYQTPCEKPEQSSRIILSTSFTAEVTPILEPSYPTDDEIPTHSQSGMLPSVSPRLLRLVASAQKIRAVSTQNYLNRKSYSTPRKRRHVRSLNFNTPPRVKGSSEAGSASKGSGGKSKSGIEFKSESKSRQKLQWDKEKYKSAAFPDRSFSIIDSAKKIYGITNSDRNLEKIVEEKNSSLEETSISKKTNCSNSMDSSTASVSIFEEIDKRIEAASALVDIGKLVEAEASASAKKSQQEDSCPLPKVKVVEAKAKIDRKKKESKPVSQKTKSEDQKQLETQLFGSESSDSSDEEVVPPKAKKPKLKKSTPIKKGRVSVAEAAPILPSPSRRSRRLSGKQRVSTQALPAVAEKVETPQKKKSPEKRRGKEEERKRRGKEEEERKKRKKKASSSPTTNPPRKSRRVDVEAAKSVAASAIALGRSPRKSGSPSKRGNKTKPSETVSVPSQTPKPANTLTLHSTESHSLRISGGQIQIQSGIPTLQTPGKNSLPFSIIPAPIGFPDPTPVKQSASAPVGLAGCTYELVTPVKLPQTPTPRYGGIELDSNSNSNSNWSFNRSFGLSTPYKALALPPTPGRDLILEDRSQGAQSQYLMGIHDPGEEMGRKAADGQFALDLTSPAKPLENLDASVSLPLSLPSIQVSINRSTPAIIIGRPQPQSGSNTPVKHTISAASPAPKEFTIPKLVLKRGPSAAGGRPSVITPTKAASPPLAQSTPKQNGLNSSSTLNEIENNTTLVPVSTPDLGPLQKFSKEGGKSCLVMSQPKEVIQIIESPASNQQESGSNSKVSPRPSPDVAMRNMLKKVDLNDFLKRFVHNKK